MFSWWKKSREDERAPKFMGVRLDKNHYLGYSKIRYIDEEDEERSCCLIHFFVNKEDHTKRKFVYDGSNESDFYNHGWMINARMWKINERELYRAVITFPSKWLREYMLQEYNNVWSDEKKWWVQNLEDKIENKQDNVITVNFKE